MKLTHSLTNIRSVDDIFPQLKTFQKYRCSFFTSASWIKHWLGHTDSSTNKYCLSLKHNGTEIGFAVFDEIIRRRRIFFKPAILSLHDSNSDEYDFTIEYNELLVDPQYLTSAIDSLLHTIAESHRHHEIKLNAITSETFNEIQSLVHNYPILHVLQDKTSPCQIVDLTKFSSIDEYRQFLSKKRKYQLRKSEDYYSRYGEIKVQVAENCNEALKYFDELGELHENKWQSNGEKGAFSNPVWVNFHKAIISDEFNNNKIILFKLTAGMTTVGVLYIFLDMNKSCVIQTGFLYEADKFAQPGFLTHYYFIEYAISQNISEYDFLAGDNLYKRSLSTDTEQLYWVTIQKKTLTAFIENTLLYIKRNILKIK